MEDQISVKENQYRGINKNANHLLWFKYVLENYFDDKHGIAFNRMIHRNDGVVKKMILNFCNIPLENEQDRKKNVLVFYKTEYEKIFYKQISIMKKGKLN